WSDYCFLADPVSLKGRKQAIRRLIRKPVTLRLIAVESDLQNPVSGADFLIYDRCAAVLNERRFKQTLNHYRISKQNEFALTKHLKESLAALVGRKIHSV